MGTRRRVHGIDFSGAVDAGRRIWIASGVTRGGALEIEACGPASERLGTEPSPVTCLRVLRAFIRGERAAIVGCDFPFGLPEPLVDAPTWAVFARTFPRRFRNAEEFRLWCVGRSDGRELRRVTDRETRTPWSAYNRRLYRQTYFGIAHVLSPLVRDRAVCVLPMQRASSGLPWLVEVCPASLLKKEGLAGGYKGGSRRARAERRAVRRRILRHFEQTVPLRVAPALRSAILDDPGGDALDSVIAAVAAYRAVRDPTARTRHSQTAYALEGYVFT
jgi:hypothetical protein